MKGKLDDMFYLYEKENGNKGIVTFEKMQELHQLLHYPTKLKEYLELLKDTKRSVFAVITRKEIEEIFMADGDVLDNYISSKLDQLVEPKEVDIEYEI